MRTTLRLAAAAALTLLVGHLMPEHAGATLAIGPALIGAGIGALGGLFGGGGDQSTTVRFDPATQAYIEQYLRPGGIRLSNAAAGIGPGIPGLDPSFDPASYQDFMDPYLQQVRDASLARFDANQEAALAEARKRATLAGTGRGSGLGVELGLTRSEGALNRAQLDAGLSSAGYTQAQGLALNRSQADLKRILAASGILADSVGPYGQTTTVSGNQAGPLERVISGGASGYLFGAGISDPAAADPAAASTFSVGTPRVPELPTFDNPSLGPMAPPADNSLFRPPSIGDYGRYRYGAR